MALAYAGVTCELREVVLRDKPPSMLHYSAKGEVPVLVVGERVIDESRDVMAWALEQADPERWLARHDPLHEQLVERADTEFKPLLDRYKYHERYPGSTQAEYRDQAAPFLAELASLLDHQPYLAGTAFGLVDVALLPFVRQFANVDRLWFETTQPSPLNRWLIEWLESDLFLGVMGKYPQWQKGDQLTEFP